MLIAHLPAGYLVTKAVIKRLRFDSIIEAKYLWMLGVLFSIVPDLDLFYFYLFDSSVHHHKLFPHLPIFWLGAFMLFFALAFSIKSRALYYAGLVCGINVLVHLLLDTFVGFVWWLYPAIDKPYYLVLIPNNYGHWIINFILHWSFVFELIIVGSAIYSVRKKA